MFQVLLAYGRIICSLIEMEINMQANNLRNYIGVEGRKELNIKCFRENTVIRLFS